MPGILDGLSGYEDDPEIQARGLLDLLRQRANLDHPLTRHFAEKVKRVGTIPERATRAAGELHRTGEYDPGPALEALQLGPMLSAPGAVASRLPSMVSRGAVRSGIGPGGGDTGTSLSALYLQPGSRNSPYYSTWASQKNFDLVDETGLKKADVVGRYNPDTKHLDLDVWGVRDTRPLEEIPRTRPISKKAMEANRLSWTNTLSDMRTAPMAARHNYPEAETYGGLRISGTRAEDNAKAIEPLRRYTDEQMARYLAKAPGIRKPTNEAEYLHLMRQRTLDPYKESVRERDFYNPSPSRPVPETHADILSYAHRRPPPIDPELQRRIAMYERALGRPIREDELTRLRFMTDDD